MKTKIFIGLIIVAFIATSCGNSGKNTQSTNDSTITETSVPVADNPASTVKKYPVKSGIITYNNEGMGIKQKIVLYFDDYGMKEAEDIYTDDDKIRESALCDGSKRYTVIYDQKVAYDAGSCYRGIAYKFDWNEISQADKEYKVKKLPNRVIAGKDCDAYSLEAGEFPTIFAGWNNLLLYQETKSKFGTIIKTAIKVEVDIEIPTDKLAVPAGFEVKKASF